MAGKRAGTMNISDEKPEAGNLKQIGLDVSHKKITG
jgi:hypothetical protein